MQTTLNNLKIPLFSLLLTGLLASIFLPLLPIDETRYVSVAWEMQNAGSYAVPLLNGAPYAHKPPLLFWLIQADWKLFGVHDSVLRLIPVCFSLLCIVVLYRISLLLWPEERKTASCAALVLGSTVIWLLWSCAIMFDIILTFWVLIAFAGILYAENDNAPLKSWGLLTLGVAGGLLTKGPIVLVYILPLIFLHALWSPERPPQWKIRIFTALLAGFGVAMLWAVPAAIQGGEDYRHAIFWSQTVNRISSSFAHRRPVWWYIPLLPVIFFPWVLFRPAFSKIRFRSADKGTRLAVLWLAVPLIILSLISGKQIHYLVPLIPAGALLMGRNIARSKGYAGKTSAKVIGILYLLLGLAALALPLVELGADVGRLEPGSTRFAAAGLLIAGLLLLSPLRSPDGIAKRLAISTMLFLFFGLFEANKSFMEGYDIKKMSVFIKNKMDEGHAVANIGKYYGQYQFLGRLIRPLTVLRNDPDSIRNFINSNPDGILISYPRKNEIPENAIIYYRQKYRGKTAVLWSPPRSPSRESGL
jgi:4-amino-4-deoxy-L-arabinose transferase-like glycosyltransferase